MRIVIGGLGSEGDTRPVVALAAGLRDRGHEVVVVADRSGAPLAESMGVPFRTMGGDFRRHLEPGGGGRRALERDDAGLAGLLLFRRIAAEHTETWVEALTAAARDLRAEVVLGTGLVIYAALTAAELTGAQPAVGGAFPVTPTREFPSPVAPSGRSVRLLNPLSHHIASHGLWSAFRRPTNAARARRGLGRMRFRWYELPVLYGFSAALVPRPADWPPNVAICGDWHVDEARVEQHWNPPEDLADFLAAGEPPAYIGFGSMSAAGNDDLLRTLIAGLDGRRALVAPGWSGVEAHHLGPLPQTVRLIGPTPHSWLLPQCSVAVHHCGSGTTHAAARAGIPSVPVPFAADQPFWAQRLVAAGIGTTPLDRRRLTVGDARRALHEASGAALKERARQVASTMGTEDSVGAAAAHLSRWVTRQSR